MMIHRLGFQAVLGFALAIAASPLAGCAGNDGAPEPAQAGLGSQGKPELIGGEPAASDYFRTTVGIGNVCTAAKVGARLFLTAAHCVALGRPGRNESPPENYPPNEGVGDAYLPGKRLRINWGLEARDANQGDLTIVKTTIHPSWWSCPLCLDPSSNGEADIAVIQVAEDTPEIPQARVELGTILTNAQVVKVGWGCEERTNIDPTTLKLGRFKAANARVIAVNEIRRFESRMSDEQVAAVDATYLITPGHAQDPQNASLCLGDSGGPLYLPNNGDPRVVGVNSDYTFKPPEDDSDLGGVSWTDWHTRTSLGSLHGVGEWLVGLGVNTVNSQSSEP